jgi:hypothetical protein
MIALALATSSRYRLREVSKELGCEVEDLCAVF